MPKLLYSVIAALLLFSVNPPTKNKTYKVIGISDGDTFSVLIDKKPVRIRIDGIDAPEKGMPYYKVSKKYLSDLCFNKYVSVKISKTDQYGRSVGRIVLPNGKDVSAEMIKAGLAWHYKQYSKDKRLAACEIQARKSKRGLWKDKNPLAPWEVRKLHRKGISTKARFKNRVE